MTEPARSALAIANSLEETHHRDSFRRAFGLAFDTLLATGREGSRLTVRSNHIEFDNLVFPYQLFTPTDRQRQRLRKAYRFSRYDELIAALHGDPPSPEIVIEDDISLPAELAAIAAQLDSSRRILDLPDDWDGLGTPGYDEQTWLRAISMVANAARGYWYLTRNTPPTPSIYGGPDRGIDIVWKTAQRQLLINVSDDPADRIVFSGSDRSDSSLAIDGEQLITDSYEWIIQWLMS